MKPIGLVTCYFHHNYGSMLQAYATEMIIERLGLPYETIACKRPKDYMIENKLIYVVKKLLVADWKMFLGKRHIAKIKSQNLKFKTNVELRDKKFDEFANTRFHLSSFCKNRKELEYIANNYSAFIVGSDQLWRTDSVEHGYYTLDWVPDNIRKIAYSTSIGVKKIPWFQIKKNKRFMNRFNNIALREQTACDIVYKLTGRKVEVVLDPTLLFTGEEWLSIQEQEPLTDGKYIFVYLLGNNPWQRDYIKEISKLTNLKIIALLHLDDYIPSDENFADETPYNVGPSEFLNYIRNAEYIFTDSFHCSVFSILYRKNFFVFSRFSETAKQSTNTRIDNLLNLTGLINRKITKENSCKYVFEIKTNYKDVNDKLDALRKSSMEYLKNALKDLSFE